MTALSTEKWLGPRNYKVFTVSIATPGVITDYAHGLTWKDQVVFATTGALPTGIVADTLYYVLPIDADTFSVSATSTGTAIDTSGTQSGVHSYASAGRNRMTMAPPHAFF
ncbi:MAG: hypothetical protein KBD16_00595 [Candidatus Pacebacteria bacterium]|nr:hypothetical protein [Candidatus Paceibacterota bacterium]